MQLQASAAIDYRHGSEIIYVFNPRPWEALTEGFGLRDWGLSAGLRSTYDLPWRLQLSAAARYTRFVYVAHKGVEILDGTNKGPTPNTLTLKFGLGYRF